MAKYDDMYPEAAEDFISQKLDKLPPVVKFPEAERKEAPHLCACGQETNWVNATATKFVCSTECNLKLWEQILGIFVQKQITGDF